MRGGRSRRLDAGGRGDALLPRQRRQPQRPRRPPGRVAARMGQAVLIFDYPGYGRSGGRPSESGCYAAADTAHAWLTAVRRVPADRLVILGRSLGAGVAVDLACRRPHRALVLYSPFTSFPDLAQEKCRWLPARRLLRNRFDNLSKIAGVHAPCSSPTARPTAWCRSTTAGRCSPGRPSRSASCRCRAGVTTAASVTTSMLLCADFLKKWRRRRVGSVRASAPAPPDPLTARTRRLKLPSPSAHLPANGGRGPTREMTVPRQEFPPCLGLFAPVARRP